MAMTYLPILSYVALLFLEAIHVHHKSACIIIGQLTLNSYMQFYVN